MRFTNDILPLTSLRLDILSQLYINPLKLTTLSENIGKSIASTNNSIQKMKTLVDRKEGVYYLNKEVEVTIENLIIRYLLEKKLEKMFDFLIYMKKQIDIKEIIFFGSYLKGTNKKDSDLDIYLIADIDNETIKNLKDMFFKLFKVELDLKVISPKIHMTKKDTLSNLYENISNDRTQGIKIPLNLL